MLEDRFAKLLFKFEDRFPYKFEWLQSFLWAIWRFYDKWLKWRRVKTRIKYFFQRRTRGWDDSELWNLDHVIAKFIVPRLKEFKKCKPYFQESREVPDSKNWNNILDKIIWSFEFVLTNYGVDYECSNREIYKENLKRYEEGMSLFSKYYWALWD